MKTCFGYSLGASNEYHQHVFNWEIRKIFTWYRLLSRAVNDWPDYIDAHVSQDLWCFNMGTNVTEDSNQGQVLLKPLLNKTFFPAGFQVSSFEKLGKEGSKFWKNRAKVAISIMKSRDSKDGLSIFRLRKRYIKQTMFSLNNNTTLSWKGNSKINVQKKELQLK